MTHNIDYVQLALDFVRAYGTKILSAVVILVVGYLAGKWVARKTESALKNRNFEPPVIFLITRIVQITVIVFAFLLAAQNLGVEVMPLIAGLGVAGIGLGIATQGVLGNLMAGLSIIFTKPYRVGDFIELLGVYGEVISIELFSTTLMHVDCSRVVIPNRKIVGEILHNYGSQRQLDLSVGVGYAVDLKKVIEVINQILNDHPRVLKEPQPVIGIINLEDSCIKIAVKPWVVVQDCVAAQAELYQAMINRFHAEKIEIPFPQREIRVVSGTLASIK